MSDDQAPQQPPPKQGYIPRPPSQADIDRVSSQQGMIEDEWSGEPTGPQRKEGPSEAETEGHPG